MAKDLKPLDVEKNTTKIDLLLDIEWLRQGQRQ